MPKLFYSNFDFEDELAGRRTNPKALKSLRTSLSDMWSAIAQDGDRLFDPDFEIAHATAQPTSDRHSVLTSIKSIGPRQLSGGGEQFELVPWGWSPQCLKLARQLGTTITAPDLSCVRTVNDRTFGFDFECELSIGLTGSTSIRNDREFIDGVNNLAHRSGNSDNTASVPWIVKSQFSAAGRHCLRGDGPPTQQQLSWIRKRCRRKEVVFLEPIVHRVREAGFQFWIDKDAVRFDGCVEMICDRHGQFQASIVASSLESEWTDSLAGCTQLAERVRDQGYFGPLGIDSMLYRQHDGSIQQRPIQDVNARFTMGRMALNLKNTAAPSSEIAIWLHCNCRDANHKRLQSDTLNLSFPTSTDVIQTTSAPGSKQTFLVVFDKSPDRSNLRDAVRTFLDV